MSCEHWHVMISLIIWTLCSLSAIIESILDSCRLFDIVELSRLDIIHPPQWSRVDEEDCCLRRPMERPRKKHVWPRLGAFSDERWLSFSSETGQDVSDACNRSVSVEDEDGRLVEEITGIELSNPMKSCGGAQRSSPTGAIAYGMPRYSETSVRLAAGCPTIMPLVGKSRAKNRW